MSSTADLFRLTFGRSPEVLTHAPGRINLIGEHTDTTGGFVLPMAIQHGVTVAAARCKGPSRGISEALGPGAEFFAGERPTRTGTWTDYAAGMAWVLGVDHNIEFVVTSDLAIGAGISSSAALEMALACAWGSLGGRPWSPVEAAKAGQRCENEIIGIQSGIMDQLVSAAGIEGHALLINTTTLEMEPISIPTGIAVVLCDTGSARTLAASQYNQRRADLAEAEAAFDQPLSNVTLAEVQARLQGLPRKRAKHVVTENERCRAFARALRNDDRAAMGQLLAQAHASIRNDFEASSPAQDAMVVSANSCRGCIGARMTGGGWGGACVALVESEHLNNFLREVEQKVQTEVKDNEPKFTVCRPSRGANVWE